MSSDTYRSIQEIATKQGVALVTIREWGAVKIGAAADEAVQDPAGHMGAGMLTGDAAEAAIGHCTQGQSGYASQPYIPHTTDIKICDIRQ
jgi:hypothetical protein